MSENTAYSALLAQTKAGEVYLNDEAAAYHMFKACDTRLADLRELLGITRRVQNVSGFGDFQMGKDLEKKFLTQATGTDNSIDAVVLKDIEAVQNLREIFSLSFKRITGQDIETANALDYTSEQVS
ncbi:hypothetical protein NN3_44140 [Nocardia neocaledoniensis NBRC 108232]|uniref:Uncharacterized protein n=1 Tax=Nocardia neocaledoniensis TaxID=236511 RepID=A0A317NM04_9NOCA|nr:hypothetical protein [Nocardia neocaledoniensis]PWV75942.1 hypothetical protein DFR69_10443 [Nocardia neocaledoniensis]GEM33407.1 hypothetical protein NN3_44140 [Nocardia neocaledoniensis NBRC 108232]